MEAGARGALSPLRYSARFSTPSTRDAVSALYAYADEIQAILNQSRSPDTRLLKLGYWQRELAQAQCGSAQHPLARALAKNLTPALFSHPDLAQVIECAQREGEYAGRFSATAFLDLLAGEWGAPLRLAADVQGASGTASAHFATTIGLAWGLTERLQHIGLTFRRRPEELSSLMALGSVTVDAERDAGRKVVFAEDAFQGAVAALYETALSHYEQAFALWPKVRQRALYSHIVLARLGRTLLSELAASRDILLQAQVLLPQRRLSTTAWRCLVFMRLFGRP